MVVISRKSMNTKDNKKTSQLLKQCGELNRGRYHCDDSEDVTNRVFAIICQLFQVIWLKKLY